MKKYILTILLAGALLLSACGGNNKETEETESRQVVDIQTKAPSDAGTESSSVENTDTSAAEASEETSEEETLLLEDVLKEFEDENQISMPHLYAAPNLQTDSLSYCALNSVGDIVIAANEFKEYEPASITKVLTALIVCENVSLDTMCEIQESELSFGIGVMSSGVYPSFKPGEAVSVRDLLNALLLPSTNTAGNILADCVAGSIDAFVQMMNDKAEELGCKNSCFKNPHGYHMEGHYTCAYDMALIMKAASENDICGKIMGNTYYQIPATVYTAARDIGTTNPFLNGSYSVDGVVASKSGYTYQACSTLVTACERNGVKLYVCTMHSDDAYNYVDTDNVIRTAYAAMSDKTPLLQSYACNALMISDTEDSVKVSFHVNNGPATGRVVFWNLAKGTSDAQEVSKEYAAGQNEITLYLPEKGAYMVQLFTTGSSGEEKVLSFSILHTGEMKQCGLTNFNGQRYYIDQYGILKTGVIELEDTCYYANGDGGIGTGFVGGRFYADAEGNIVTGWFETGGSKYYAQHDGRIATGALIIDGQLHHFNDGGVMID